MATDKKTYKDSLNLPQTTFPMEAKLVQNEPARLKKWQDANLYEQVMAARANAPRWVLHDGPPFANGDIHIGHVINKTLKDVILRFRTMQGFQTPYVPGWDCHGLPIEHKIQEEVKKEGKNIRELSTLEVRQRCYKYADKYAAIQNTQFQRLGILGDWANPYLTMRGPYEAATLEVFAKFVENGLVYKQLKPVPWSVSNQTALADAELEYQDVEDPSVYVEFPAVDSQSVGRTFLSAPSSTSSLPAGVPISFLVWTTTPWTLPANLAIAVHPEVLYALVEYTRNGQTRLGVAAADLVKANFERKGIESHKVLATAKGDALLHQPYRHPFVDRVGKILPALYVTTTDGTGLVHTAPGHGEDDYNTGIANGLEVYCPVMANGRFDDTAPEWIRGKQVWEANPIIVDKLRELDVLFDSVKITHSYPHDWRSKKPVILRATEQWFIGMDEPFSLESDPVGLAPRTLRERAMNAVLLDPDMPMNERQQRLVEQEEKLREKLRREAEEDEREGSARAVSEEESRKFFEGLAPELAWINVDGVRFIPGWGQNRLRGMLESRPDWCISRQRAWGLPIPVFYNEKGDALLTKESVLAVAEKFKQHGSDAWFTMSPAELLEGCETSPNFPKDKLRKEQDIFDVWFESGSSWHAVLQKRDYLGFPADLYLEGSDQHRGWFQLSLLPSLGYGGAAPFKSVLTHGFVVKPDGKKVSKSDKEYVTATQEIERHGADLLRLWCCSVDYQYDIPVSPQVIKEFGDKYRKIRNTIKYLLSNLYDFAPATDAQEIPASSLDGWVSAELDALIRDVTAAYDRYELHSVFRLLHDFCNVQISAVYGNAMKDRLYCEAPASPLRRRCQTVMHRMSVALIKLLAPMIVFTADEAWEHLKHKPAGEENCSSVHLAALPKPAGDEPTDDQKAEWKLLMELRDSALLQLDRLKKEVGLNKALDAEVIYHVDDAQLKLRLQKYGADLTDLVGAGCHTFAEKGPEGPAVVVEVVDRREKYQACARSWKRRPDVGSDAEYPDLSLRDALAMKAIKK